jgi:recombination protein RecA
MSSAVFSTSAAWGRPFLFDVEAVPELYPTSDPIPSAGQSPQRVRLADPSTVITSADSRLAAITPASRLEGRPTPEMASSGIAAIDALTGGLPRGCVSEICGPASSGRTTLLLAALAAATRRGEFCVVVDASDALDPHSAVAAGVELERLLWVRCGESSPQPHASISLSRKSPRFVKDARHGAPTTFISFGEKNSLRDQIQLRNKNQAEHRLEQVLRATDLLLESGGFGLIVLDLGDLPPQSARRIPLTTWFRFRRAVEYKPTILLVLEEQPIAGSCSSLLLKLSVLSSRFSVLSAQNASAKPSHAQLLTGLEITAELVRSRLERKPVRSASVAFTSKTAWG